MMRPGYIDAVASLRPTYAFQIENGKITSPDDGFIAPSEKEIQKELARLQEEFDKKQYQKNREPEYPSIGDQLDDLFKAGLFSKEMAARIQAVKDKYPKG